AFSLQDHRTHPGLAHFKGTLTGNFTLPAVNTVVKIDPHGFTFVVVTDHVGGAVFDDEILEIKIKFLLAENGLGIIFRKSSVRDGWVFWFVIYSQFDSVGWAGFNTNAAIHALFFVHIDGGFL